jgi:hypothetical protein
MWAANESIAGRWKGNTVASYIPVSSSKVMNSIGSAFFVETIFSVGSQPVSVTSFPMGMVRSLAAVFIYLVNDTERKTTVRELVMQLF